MFSKNSNERKAPPESSKNKNGKMETIIGSDTELNGVIRCQGIVRIDGRVTGKIIADKATIIVGAGGYVDAGISAEHIIISGEVHGNLVVTGTLELLSTGKLYGYVQALGLQISDGAVFRGNCDMIQTEPMRIFVPETTEGQEEGKEIE